jgi:hypothetical protein
MIARLSSGRRTRAGMSEAWAAAARGATRASGRPVTPDDVREAPGDQAELYLRTRRRAPDRPLQVSPAARASLKTGHLFPKKGIPASAHLEAKACGKPGCRCARGELHGPYLTLRWREGGRQRRRYVPLRLVLAVRKELERRRGDPAYWSTRRLMTALRLLMEGGP